LLSGAGQRPAEQTIEGNAIIDIEVIDD